ncbi:MULTISPECIES: hypothetical protein [Myxococcus]|uniref:hypothetical protein n=1 Tax=Myxococcus TaxID=32 RepID=UPI0002FC3929|nr:MULTISPECIES: hypothetical protein [Myxococcus]QZZ54386.1 hypothetical protein MyxoNM_34675 [Myxococcus xanthus]UYI14024.1 hypothetical protein N3T43_34015 [Myxococcus xanthus]UYI21391.1 hypothetical protein N1129_34475 [Myxococcus xanthus]SDW18767.1 hypothetical protein SAMN05444383_101561 [Myxococcus xanthus]
MRQAPQVLRLLTVLLAVGTGVGCPMGPCEEHGPSPLFNDAMVGVGQPQALTVHGVFSRCDSSQEDRAQSVSVEVRDPQNRVVPATAQLAVHGRSAIVRFTPEQTGRHHLVVAFSPVGSIRQSSLYAVEDHSAQAPLADLSTVLECRGVDRTSSGTWLCGSQALRTPDQEPQPLGDYFAPAVVAGDVVWVTEAARVRRYVDLGNGPLATSADAPFPATGAPADAPPHARLATATELLLLDETHLHRYAFSEEEGLRATGSPPVPPSRLATFSDDIPSLLMRAGERLLVVRIADAPAPATMAIEACPYQLDAAGAPQPVPGEPCHSVPGLPVGHEEGVLWVRAASGPQSLALLRYSAASGRLRLDGVMEMTSSFHFQGAERLRTTGFGVPVVSPATGSSRPYAVPRWSAETGTVVLELLPSPDGRRPPFVGRRYFHLEHWNILYGVKVYARPSTP